jgi:hypothetical protein
LCLCASAKWPERFAFSASDSATDWLMAKRSRRYLYAVLVEAHLLARNFETRQFKSAPGRAIDDLTWESAREDSQAPLSVDPALIFMRPFNIVTG